jgi:hypothetical protein
LIGLDFLFQKNNLIDVHPQNNEPFEPRNAFQNAAFQANITNGLVALN